MLPYMAKGLREVIKLRRIEMGTLSWVIHVALTQSQGSLQEEVQGQIRNAGSSVRWEKKMHSPRAP